MRNSISPSLIARLLMNGLSHSILRSPCVAPRTCLVSRSISRRAQAVQRQQDEMQDQDGIQVIEISVCDESAIAADSDQTQRNHCLHVESQSDEDSGEISNHVRKIHWIS